MEKDAFLFYRSFYEAIKPLSKDIQCEVYTAIMEYALYGNLPTDLKPFAQSAFTLIKPLLDANSARYANGSKGAAFGHLGGRPRKSKQPTPPVADISPKYSASFADEADKMKSDTIWLESVCMLFSIDTDECMKRLQAFTQHCQCEKSENPHSDINDAKRHFLSWMRKAYPASSNNNRSTPTDYSYDGGFGSIDV